MWTRCVTAALVVLATSTTAWADGKNLQLFNDVSRQILRYTHYTIFDNVEAGVDNGVITLTGEVTMPYKRQDIEHRVAGVNGVLAVRNKISVLPVSQWDDQLRLQIARAIYRHPAFTNYSRVNPPIHVIVEHGRVTLEGVVRNELDRAVARSIASSFQAFSIKTDLKTEEEVREQLEKL